jgi:hypothetical protein
MTPDPLTTRTPTPAEFKLFVAACHEIPAGHEDGLEIRAIVGAAIRTVFGETPFTDADWEVLEPILRKIGPHDARQTSEPYIISLERFHRVCGFQLTEINPALTYVRRFRRQTSVARLRVFYPLAIVSVAWQVARFGKDDVLLTSNAFDERYAPAA